MQKPKKKCIECSSTDYYARGWCYKCYEKNTRKRGVCSSCGSETCRAQYTKCNACENKENPKHAQPHSAESREKMRINNWRAHNEKHPQWKGNEVGYHAIHSWIRRHKGVPDKCERCDKKCRLHASNKDHKYSREFSDWQFLCPKCHKEYDIANGLYSHSGENHHLYGKQQNTETRTKISETLKRKGISPQLYKK